MCIRDRGKAQGNDHLAAIREHFSTALGAYEECVEWIASNYKDHIREVHAGSVPFLKLSGIVAGGWQMARAALLAQERLDAGKSADENSFYEAKIVTARFFADHLLAQVPGLRHAVIRGAAGTLGLENDQFQ